MTLPTYNAMPPRSAPMTYSQAIRALNKAAYDAIRAGRDTSALPSIDRQSLRLIARETDRLVDFETNSGEHPSHIKEDEQ